ncbi:MAG: hypothetical protein KAG84_05615 [Bacteroidales bacterium]|nr:hypothetical protein [Bacteroidales bacterium]
MIFWKGRGILVPVILLIVSLLTGLLLDTDSKYFISVALLLSAFITWYLGRKWNNAPGQIVVDKETGEEIELVNEHTLYFIKMQYWGVIEIALAVFMFFALNSKLSNEGGERGKEKIGEYTIGDNYNNFVEDTISFRFLNRIGNVIALPSKNKEKIEMLAFFPDYNQSKNDILDIAKSMEEMYNIDMVYDSEFHGYASPCNRYTVFTDTIIEGDEYVMIMVGK